jgi:mannitol 2-dehydrogenase
MTIALKNSALPQITIPKPTYDRGLLKPGIIHFGVGGFHRAHQAVYLDNLMEQGKAYDWGIAGVGLLPPDAKMRDALISQDCLYTVVTRDADGDQAQVVGSLCQYLLAPDNPESVLNALADPAVRIVTLTITEGGYALDDPYRPPIAFEYLASALKRRHDSGTPPFTVLSCDNVQQNGRIARDALVGYAQRHDKSLADWISQSVAFPSSMVDRITPQTTDDDRDLVCREFGIQDRWPVVCEPFRQWVVEDHFCNGRPPLEEAGVQMVEDVHPYELMKIRLLNAGHSALGYLGCLAGYHFIHEAAADPEFQALLEKMWEEVTPLLLPVPGIDLKEYQATLLQRFANPRIKDQVARICLDGSAKMPRFVLPSLQEQLARGGPHRFLTLVVAGWMRYLSGTDDAGRPILIEDPMAKTLQEQALLGGPDPKPLLDLQDLFGDLRDNHLFVAELSRVLQQLFTEGTRATLGACLGL